MELVGKIVAGGVFAFFVVTQLVGLAIAFSVDDVDDARQRIDRLRKVQFVVLGTFIVPIVFVRFRRGLIGYYGMWEWLSWPLAALAILVGLLLASLTLELEKESFAAASLAFLVALAFWSFVIVIADMDQWIGS